MGPCFRRDDASGFKFQTATDRLSRSRSTFLLESCPLVRLPLKRGRREYRALDAPAVSCARCNRKRTRAYRSHRNHPAFPAQWFTAYIVLSPATGLFCHRRRRNCFHRLDTSVGVPGPHVFAVRFRAVRYRRIRVHRIPPPTFCDDRETPLNGGGTTGI